MMLVIRDVGPKTAKVALNRSAVIMCTMQNIRYFFAAACLMIAVLPAHAQQSHTYSYQASFRMEIPEGWETYHDMGLMNVLVRGPQVSKKSAFQPSVNVIVDGSLAVMSEQEYWDQTATQFQQMLNGFTYITTAPIELDGTPGTRSVFEHTMNGHRLRVLNYTIITSDRAYVLTGTALQDQYEEFEPLFEQIMQSFRYR